MYQVVKRRFAHYQEGDKGFEEAPNLILIDGGVNHANTAVHALRDLELAFPVFGMVKDDRHRTRGVVNSEGKEIEFLKTSESFRLLSSLQEEVHRFAITYHKKLRSKHITGSALENIEGVGKETRKKLMRHFKTISAIKKAEVDELKQVPGLSERVSQNVYNFFHEKP